jgi:hypothetical protein
MVEGLEQFRCVDYSLAPLWQRKQVLQFLCENAGVEPTDGGFRVLYEDPEDPDAPVLIMQPARWQFMALLVGGIMPPVEIWWKLRELELEKGYLTRDEQRLQDTAAPIGPLTPKDALLYLIMRDVPPRVWRDYKGNRQILRVVRADAIPADRRLRNAWRIRQREKEAA